MEEIQNKLETVNDLFNNLNILNNQQEGISDKDKLALTIKYKIFSDNLDTIIENLTDLTQDLTDRKSILPENIINLCYNNRKVDEICKEFYPLILLSIVNKNFNDQRNL
tara:strand:+ start:631 stop:957 length:327 start_codon:yes stop_codon:yes gene_type:complete